MRTRGFTLIELSIVLTVSGLMLAAFLGYYTVYLQKQKFDTTKERMKEIRTALTIYAATEHRLPCPEGREAVKSVSSRRPSSLKSAREKEADRAAEDVCRLDAPVPPGVEVFNGDKQGSGPGKQVWIGALPLRALRLGGDMGMDGWGNPFTYAVSRKLTLPDGMHENPTPPGVISIVDEFGKNLLDKVDTGRWVLVSHGPSANGAMTSSGGRRPCNGKGFDTENCNGDGLFVIAPYSRKSGTWFFDDLVIHDDLDAGGSVLDRIIACNGKRKFYSPGEASADDEGCLGPTNAWEGLCLQSEVTDENNEVHKKPAEFALPPATGAGSDCNCQPGYKLVRSGQWDNGFAKLYIGTNSNLTFTDPAGNNVPVGDPLPDGSLPLGVNPTATRSTQYMQRTTLFTCVQP